MKTSETTKDVFTALAAAQAAMKSAAKDNNNPAFKSKYADLTSHVEAIRPAFAAHKLAVLQELTSTEHGVDVTTRIAHASGEWVECGPFFVPVDKHNAHGYGSACSYARRYALSAAVGTVADDDDGNAAVEAKPYVVPRPVGYTAFLASMDAAAAHGIDAMREAFSAGHKACKHYLTEVDVDTFTTIKDKATAAKAA